MLTSWASGRYSRPTRSLYGGTETGLPECCLDLQLRLRKKLVDRACPAVGRTRQKRSGERTLFIGNSQRNELLFRGRRREYAIMPTLFQAQRRLRSCYGRLRLVLLLLRSLSRPCRQRRRNHTSQSRALSFVHRPPFPPLCRVDSSHSEESPSQINSLEGNKIRSHRFGERVKPASEMHVPRYSSVLALRSTACSCFSMGRGSEHAKTNGND